MSRIQVDLRVPGGLPVPQVADFIARCEDAGFDGVGMHDHPHSGRDVYAMLALAAARTRHLRLYPATSSPVVRHPLLLASAAHTLDEIAPGRIALTVAPGFLAVRSLGRPRATVDEMRVAVRTIRQLLAGETVTLGSRATRLRNTSPQPIPVYLLAAGPRMLEVAGEVADGVLALVGLHPAAIAAARARIEAGARRAKRSLSGFRTIFIVPVAIADTVQEAAAWIRGWCEPDHSFLTYPSKSNLIWLREAGFDLADDLDPAALTGAEAARIADAFGLFGPPEHCAERLLRARDEAGVDHVFFFPAHTIDGSYEMPSREVEAFGRIMRRRLE
jgi:5,10-methylenetetrahydromethanopterin reductase